MDKKMKFPMYIISHKNGAIVKIKSFQELNIYKTKFGYNFSEYDHYPSKNEIQAIIDKYKEI